MIALAPHALTLTIEPSSEEESMSSGWPFSFSRSSCPARAVDGENIISMGEDEKGGEGRKLCSAVR